MNHLFRIYEKIFSDYSECKDLVAGWKKRGDTIVFTNGCFDLIHEGHIIYLSKAASKGDHLLIGLNSDASVTRLKGNSRPLLGQDTRALVLASLFFVDGVILFEEDTPESLIAQILPDSLVKGSDYKIEEIAGADIVFNHGGKVETIELIPDASTTSIINKIKAL